MKIKKNIAVSESGFVFVPNTGDSYSLNPVAMDIVHAINDNKTFDEIRSAIESKYDVEPSHFEKDFQDFIHQLKQFQMVDNGNDN